MNNYLLPFEEEINIEKYDASEYKTYSGNKNDAISELSEIRQELKLLQKVFRAKSDKKLLIVFQGMDTSGKDGSIRNVFEGVDINGLRVAHFDKPTETELRRDFLWRVHNVVPKCGEIVLFNRSHYEDVLIVRVQNLKPKSIWEKRFDHINNFEKLLYDEGTVIIKLFLNIDYEEQTKRLQRRIDNPDKHWKIHPNDFKDRQKWDDYVIAYNEMLKKTNKKHSPWYIIPANKKWYRNLIAGRIILNELRKLELKYPSENSELKGLVLK
jgi:PPK2 family polyphosphate:nucleotide phosphotransferase